MPIIAVSVLGWGSTRTLYFRYVVLLNMSQDFISSPQSPGASTWRGVVTMNDANARAQSTIQVKDPFHKKSSMNYEWALTKFGKSKLPSTSLHKLHKNRHPSLAKSG
jgi:hypothetical protein